MSREGSGTTAGRVNRTKANGAKGDADAIVPIARNKRATFDYELADRLEAGLVLLGSEVKMLRAGKADLTDAYCAVQKGEAWLHGLNIPILSGAAFGHEAKRSRKLLLHEPEIDRLARAVARDGMTIVVTALYFKSGRAKVEIALAKGKKTIDKRETLKEKSADKEARAAIARARRG